jgi:hypothetical protein
MYGAAGAHGKFGAGGSEGLGAGDELGIVGEREGAARRGCECESGDREQQCSDDAFDEGASGASALRISGGGQERIVAISDRRASSIRRAMVRTIAGAGGPVFATLRERSIQVARVVASVGVGSVSSF